jgi:class 3 adenylate cyclase
VEDWLRSIGLGDRILAFRENNITPDQLRGLSEQDLRELGLTIGERKLLLRALDTDPPPTRAPVATSSPPALLQGERRPLTVMFIDLENSTAIGEQLDPEDLLELIRDYRGLCGAAIDRFGGSVIRFVGDGILAYFGYPTAHENDPERAVRAALQVTQGISAFATPAGTPLTVRIGLATGNAVVGDLDAGGLTDRAGGTGSVLNLAARLQSLARANGIVISEQTQARVEAVFECEALGSIELSGFPTPRLPWRVIGERQRSAGGSVRPVHLTKFHGRQHELAVLRRELELAVAGQGRAVLIMGEPGIGKSRLVEHLITWHLPAGTRLFRLAASVFDEDRPLAPIIDHLRAVAELHPTDERPAALRKISDILAGTAEQRKRALPILTGLAGLPFDAPGLTQFSPQELRRQTVAILVEQLLAFTQKLPVCLVIEDVHWLDPTSRGLLEAILERISTVPLLLLMTARDTLSRDWLAQAAITVLRLGRLARPDVAAMLSDLFGQSAPSGDLLDRVIHRTDGVPLFVEEVARVLLERRAEPAQAPQVSPDLEAIPASLQESLAARLDRSGAAKQLAQLAAVAGRSVRRDILAAASETSSEGLEQPLATLVEAGILERQKRLGIETFTFSHALVREAAYASLLWGRRRELHQRVARAIQAVDPAGAARDPDVLALHLSEAGLAEEAAPLWMEAARRSLARSALTEATRMLRRALVGLESSPASKQALGLRIQVSAVLGAALMGLAGPNATETREHYAKAYALCQQLPEEPAHFPIYWGRWRLDMTVERATALLGRAITGNDPGLMLQALHSNWASCLDAGLFDGCCEHVEAGLAIYASGDFSHHARIYANHDPKVCAHGARAQAWWMQGRLRTLWKTKCRHCRGPSTRAISGAAFMAKA